MPGRLLPLCLMGIAQELLWLASYTLGPLRENTTAFLILIFAAYGICLWSYLRLPLADSAAVRTVLGFALLFRLTLLPAQPHQSEDVYRYLWDARVASFGIDPYRYPPNAPELEKVRDGKIYPMLNTKPYITAYPPVSQLLFRGCYALFEDRVAPMKAVFSLLEFAALLLAWRLLRAWGKPLQPLFLMAWNPFFIFEFSHSGHSDGAMIFLVMLSFFLLNRAKPAWAMVGYAGAVLSKLHPALWFPMFFRKTGWKCSAIGIAAGAALALLFFTPSSGIRYLGSLRLFFRLFEFNAGIHYLVCYLGRLLGSQPLDQKTGGFLALLLACIAIVIWRKFPVRDERDLLHAGFWIMTADLCLATTVHPWYLSWAALALPVFPYAFMFYWTGAGFLSYVAYRYRPVFEPGWVLLVEYLPMYALMAWEIYRRRPLLEFPHQNDAREGHR